MRIVSVGEQSVCRVYRSYAPLRALHRIGHQIAICDSVAPGCPSHLHRPPELAGADVILGYRQMFENERAVRQGMYEGAAFIWDVDDDLANLPRGSNMLQGMSPHDVAERMRRLTQLARMADLVTTTTVQLARKYQRLGVKRVAVIPNYLPSAAMRSVPRPADREQLVIGWVAAGEHRADPKHVPIAKALRKLLSAHPHVRVETAGVELQLPADRYRHYRWVDIARLPDLLARWDVGIAPVADTPFNRARSDVKLKEYGAVGLPWLASPVGPYLGLGEEQGGRLVPDYAWYDALEALVTDPAARAELSANATEWAITQSIDRNAHRWEEVCEEAMRRRARRAAA